MFINAVIVMLKLEQYTFNSNLLRTIIIFLICSLLINNKKGLLTTGS
jgi:hypothetical protein